MANGKEDDSFLDKVRDMAETLGLTGPERQKYVHEHMTRAGYTMVPSYVKGDPEDEDEDDFFGSSKRRRNRDSGNKDKGGGGGGWFRE
jgi:hypothetical protein